MLKMELTDKINNQRSELDMAKKDKAQAQETKATTEGDMAIVVKDLIADHKILS